MLAKVKRPWISISALKTPEYRWFWFSRLTLSAAMQMDGVVQGWLIYHLTGSTFALGWVGSGWSISILTLSLYAGVTCDRVDKRTIIMIGRLATALLNATLGLLVFTGAIQVWHIAIASLGRGVVNAFMMPALGATTTELVDRDTLLNANAVNAMGMGLMGVLSASLAGWMIDVSGPATTYLLMAAFNILGMLILFRIPQMPTRQRSLGPIWDDLQHGFRYLKAAPMLVTVMALGLVRILFIMPYGSLLPAFVQDNLHLDASELGMLTSAASFGAMTSAILITGVGERMNKGKLVLMACLGAAFGMAGLANVRLLPVAMGFNALIGFCNNIATIVLGTLLGALAAPEYRGRVMSINMMLWGLMPIGTMSAGALAEAVGVPWVITIQGAIVLAIMVWAILRKPMLRQL